MGRWIAARGDGGYGDLWAWSVDSPTEFWSDLWDRVGMGGERGERTVVAADGYSGTRFFPDARLNAARIILDGQGVAGAAPMLVARDERGHSTTLTRDEVRAAVASLAAALRSDGVGVGDRVAAWMPNVAETVVTMLAAASVGAVFCSTSPDFGVDGVLDRFGQIEPVVLVAADGYLYGGRRFECAERLAQICAALPTVRRVIVVSHLDEPDAAADSAGGPSGHGLVRRHRRAFRCG